MNITNSTFLLRRAIQIALAGSVLASGVASAVLQDHGPSNPVIVFPDWYRDTEGLALGLCTSTSAYCFPLAANPNGFAGNFGDEAFYSLVEFKGTATGSDFQYRYLGALEASYLPGPTPTHGQETVFARIRITFNFNDPNKNGTYVVTHPFGVHTFENVQATAKTNLIGSQAANFFTIDVPLGNDFEGPLAGPVGPFIKWDTGLPLISGTEEFVGDPAIAHSFTGSPFNTNFIQIQGPVGSNLDGLADPVNETDQQLATHDIIKVDVGNVLGQKWTAPIAQPLKIDSAVKTRSSATGGKNGIDVWATSSPHQEMIVTGPGMPSLELYESSVVSGKYHGHIEYPSAQEVPAQVTVTNLSSNPVVSVSAGLVDIVEISQATFDTSSRLVTVVATTSDDKIRPNLTVQGIPGMASGPMTAELCTGLAGVAADDVCYTTNLPVGTEPPAKISVLSTDAGTEIDTVLNLIGAGNTVAATAVTNFTCSVNFTGQFELKTCGATSPGGSTLPANSLVTQQPANGTVALIGGKWFFTPSLTAFSAPDYFPEMFKYVTQTANNAPVSNEATVTLIPMPAAPLLLPTTNITTTGFTINWTATGNARSYLVTVNGLAKPFLLPPTTSFNITAPAGASTAVTVAACNSNDGRNCGTASAVTQFTLPAAPVISSVSGITGTGMTVNWGAVLGATTYTLQYATVTGTTTLTTSAFVNVGAATATTGVRLSAALSSASTSANLIGLASSSRYVYKMTATDPAGISAVSATSAVATTIGVPPAAPTTLTAATVTTTGFTLSWPTVATATSYNVTVNGVTTSQATLSKVITGLLPGTGNLVTVAACTGVTNCSAVTSRTQFTLPSAPALPSLTAPTATGVTVNWTAPAGQTVTGYTLQYSTNGTTWTVATLTTGVRLSAALTAASTSVTVAGLAASTNYVFRVSATNLGGSGAVSGASAGYLTPLLVPAGIKGVSGATNAVVTAGLTWTASAGATGYQVMYGTAAALTADTGTVVTATSGQQITLIGVTAGTNNIRMKVKAIKTTAPANTSPWSAQTVTSAR